MESSQTAMLEFPQKISDTEVTVTTTDVYALHHFANLLHFLIIRWLSSTLDNAQLLELVRQWDLKPAKRNRASYIKALEGFSADRSAWTK
jgi:hypothetical protein